MTEFGATLLSFIRLSKFENQSAYASAAEVSDSTVTRTIGGGSFSSELLAKLIAPFPQEKQVELARAYVRDRLREGPVAEPVIVQVLQSGPDAIAGMRPEVRLLLQRLGAELSADPVFQRTVEDLLELIDTDARQRRLYLVAEDGAKAKKPKPHFARGRDLPRGDSQKSAG